MKKVFCIMGPTASGKTQLATELIQKFPFEIISVDSAQVYRDLNIGSAKPTLEELKITPHRLIDIRDPAEIYSAGDFVKDATTAIEEIHANNKIPLLVGGTMLYFWALQKGFADLPTANEVIRAKISLEAEEKGWAALHEKLAGIDPISAKKINPNDSQRIQRALEIFEITGEKPSSLHQQQETPTDYQFFNIAIFPEDRVLMHEKIAKRYKQMIEAGFIDEVQALKSRGDLTIDMPSMRSVGYRQVWQYLEGELTKDQMIEKAIIATRQFSKRQITWLRRWRGLGMLDVVVEKTELDRELFEKISRLIMKR